MDKWDNEESGKNNPILGSKKALIFLIGMIAIMWVIIGGMSYYALPTNCDQLDQYINSDAFYALPESETKQNYIDAQYECNRDNIVVK